MFVAMGYRDGEALKAMEATSEPFFAKGLEDGSYRAWLVENDVDEVVAGGGIVLLDHHSSPSHPQPKRPVIVNMFTEPAYRRRGLAKRLMETMIQWSREEGFGFVFLHASDAGRPLYDMLGFEPTNEMRLKLH
jgi:GNAT superfamily N-acetyltransferase